MHKLQQNQEEEKQNFCNKSKQAANNKGTHKGKSAQKGVVCRQDSQKETLVALHKMACMYLVSCRQKWCTRNSPDIYTILISAPGAGAQVFQQNQPPKRDLGACRNHQAILKLSKTLIHSKSSAAHIQSLEAAVIGWKIG